MKSEFLTAALRLFSHRYIYSHVNNEIKMLLGTTEGVCVVGVCLAIAGSAGTLRLTTEFFYSTFIVLCLLLKFLSVPGVEPEPFEIGEHIVEASGKLCLLDKLLSFLHAGYVMLA